MKESAPQSNHANAGRLRLANLGGLAAHTAKTEEAIMSAAETRLGLVQSSIAQLRPRVAIDAAAADQYQQLILERGQLQTVIATARGHLGR